MGAHGFTIAPMWRYFIDALFILTLWVTFAVVSSKLDQPQRVVEAPKTFFGEVVGIR